MVKINTTLWPIWFPWDLGCCLSFHPRLRLGRKLNNNLGPKESMYRPRVVLYNMEWEWAIFDIRKHIFATFQDVYCHIMPEWCWTTIQETPVSLLSAPEMREPAPSARVLPSQGWAPAPAPTPWIRAWSARPRKWTTYSSFISEWKCGVPCFFRLPLYNFVMLTS